MKIPFFCSYIPASLLEALGYEVEDITLFTEETCGLEYSCSLHDNLCSYAKYLYGKILAEEKNFNLTVVPNTCNAMKKLHSALSLSGRMPSSFLLDVPRRTNQESAVYLARQYRAMIEAVSPDFDETELLAKLAAAPSRISPLAGASAAMSSPQQPMVGVAGSSYPPTFFKDIFEPCHVGAVFLTHCGYAATPTVPEALPPASLDDCLYQMAKNTLQNTLCPRADRGGMAAYLADEIREKKLAGLIITSLKFCDFYAFELERVKKLLPEDFPVLYLENDLSVGNDEQNRTRIEAMLEKILIGRKSGTTGDSPRRIATPPDCVTMGIDIGSTTTKGILLKGGREILGSVLLTTSVNMKDGAEEAMESLLSEARMSRCDVTESIVTGYGRTAFSRIGQITEITCHALGVHFLHNAAATVIDIGGQDSKAIRIDATGRVLRFTMNDKCAAGTGKFLESMVKRLNITFEDFSRLSISASEATPISSMCSVFAESEVVSLMARGVPVANIVRGLNAAVAARTRGLVGKVQGEPPFVLTGGLSHNTGFIRELETALAAPVAVFKESQFAGAIGAALAAASANGQAC